MKGACPLGSLCYRNRGKIYSNLHVRVTYIYKLTINSVCIDGITGQISVPLSSWWRLLMIFWQIFGSFWTTLWWIRCELVNQIQDLREVEPSTLTCSLNFLFHKNDGSSPSMPIVLVTFTYSKWNTLCLSYCPIIIQTRTKGTNFIGWHKRRLSSAGHWGFLIKLFRVDHRNNEP